MKHLALTCLMVALIAGCASAPKPSTHAAPDPHKTPLAAVGVFECGKMKGILVVTKAGDIVAVEDDDKDDLAAVAKGLPADSAGVIDLTDNCPPTESTRFQ